MAVVFKLWKLAAMTVGGMVGWMIAEFRPTFPLIAVAVIFIMYDAWTAFKLDRRVHVAYPERHRDGRRSSPRSHSARW